MSLGWYEGELIRRVDPDHRTLGRFFKEEIAEPLDLDVMFGAPEDFPRSRLAPDRAGGAVADHPAGARPAAADGARHAQPALDHRQGVRQSPHSPPRRPRLAPKYRSVEFPAGGAIGSARDIARAYSAFAVDPPELGLSADTLDQITRPPTPPRKGWRDVVLKVENAWSLGFARPHGDFRFGTIGALASATPAPAARSRSPTPTATCRSPT